MSSKSIHTIFDLYRFKVGAFFETQCRVTVVVIQYAVVQGEVESTSDDYRVLTGVDDVARLHKVAQWNHQRYVSHRLTTRFFGKL